MDSLVVLAQSPPTRVFYVGPILLGVILLTEVYIAVRYRKPAALILTVGGLLTTWFAWKGVSLLGTDEKLVGAVLLLGGVLTVAVTLWLLLRPTCLSRAGAGDNSAS